MANYNSGAYGPPSPRRRRLAGPQNISNPVPQMNAQNIGPAASQQQNNPNNVQGLLRNLSSQLTHLSTAFRLGKPSAPTMALPDRFRGRADPRNFEAFLKELYRLAKYYGWNEERLVQVLPLCLEGEALALFDSLLPQVRTKWRATVDALYAKLTHSKAILSHQRKLQSRRQREYESIPEFAQAIQELVNRAYPSFQGYTLPQKVEIAINAFQNGLKPSIREHVLRKTAPNTFDAALADALDEEELQRELRDDTLENRPLVASADDMSTLTQQMGNTNLSTVAFANANFRHPFRGGYNQKGDLRRAVTPGGSEEDWWSETADYDLSGYAWESSRLP